MGLTAVPFLTAYSTSKFALVGLAECLRAEMAAHGIGVTTICPLVVDTLIWQVSTLKGFSRNAVRIVSTTGMTSPEKIARIIVKSVRRNKGLVVLTFLGKVFYVLKRISHRLFELVLKITAGVTRKYEVK